MEISLQLRSEVKEVPFEEANANWEKRIRSIIDFDSLAYQAIQLCMSIVGIRTVADWAEMRRNKRKNEQYVMLMQTYYDGFIMGAEFQKRGGHREPDTRDTDRDDRGNPI